MNTYDSYKDCEIPWIERIPSTWAAVPNKKVMEKKKILCSTWNGEDVMSLTMNGVIVRDLVNPSGKMPATFDGYQYVEAGDLLMCLFDIDVTPRCVGRVFQNGVTSPAYSRFQLLGENHVGYYYYYYLMLDNTKELLHFAKNIRHSFTEEQLGTLKVPVPPLEEQKKIAQFLDIWCSKIDSIIEDVQKSIEEYKQFRDSVLFEAVTKGLDKNAELYESGIDWIGSIPIGWKTVKITRLLDYTHPYPIGDGDHGLVKPSDYTDSGIPYIRVQNLGWGTEISLDGIVYIPEEINDKISSSVLKPNDVLFAKTGGTIGKTGIVPDEIPISNTTSHVGKITIAPQYSAKYVFYVLSSIVGYNQFWEAAAKKTTRPELSIDEMKSLIIVLPSSREEQDKIVEYLDREVPMIDALISEKQAVISELETYKQSLIYEAVTGKRKVV